MQPQFNVPIPPTKPLLRATRGIMEMLVMLRAHSVLLVRLPVSQARGPPRVPSVPLEIIRCLPTLRRVRPAPPVRLPVSQARGQPRVILVPLEIIQSLPTLRRVPSVLPVRLPILVQVQGHPGVLLAPWASIRCLPT